MTAQEVAKLSDVAAEAAILATLLDRLDWIYNCEELNPRMFSSIENGHLYHALRDLADKGLTSADAFSLGMALRSHKSTAEFAKTVTEASLAELCSMADVLARNTIEDFLTIVKRVVDLSYRRETIGKIDSCRRLALDPKVEDVQQRVYQEITDVVTLYQNLEPPVLAGDRIDAIWEKLSTDSGTKDRINFPFRCLDDFVTIERGSLCVVGGAYKTGKSFAMQACLIEMLKNGIPVTYLDSEIDTPAFMHRLLCGLAGVEFIKVRNKSWSPEEGERLALARKFIKEHPFVHTYVPQLTRERLISITKQSKARYGCEGVIVDYLKQSYSGKEDAWSMSNYMGELTNCLQNELGGCENMFVVAAAQAVAGTTTLASSAQIVRNCSSLVIMQRKTPEEMMKDGRDCGNMKLIVAANRQGKLDPDGCYHDINFEGDLCRFRECNQHECAMPF